MGQLLGIREGLCFANFLIEVTVHEEAVLVWNTQLKLMGNGVSILGSKYWRNAKRRNDDILGSGSGEMQASLCKG